MIVAAYYTVGTPYEGEAAELAATCRAVGLECAVRAMPHPGSWVAANLMNASVIQDVRMNYPNDSVLYLDADARVRSWPLACRDYEKSGYDFAVYRTPWCSHLADPPGTQEICSGTSWWGAWNKSDAATAVLDAWIALNHLPETRRGCDQLNLSWLVKCVMGKEGVKMSLLPDEYCWIDLISESRIGKREPVIYHTQASRRLKGVVDGVCAG